ncbi:MAG: EAL domain-containing protein [Clostridia bacterium]|nr:EAL domain-containing protein [Clostridia bacterium]
MTTKFINDLILSNAFELYGQPKWTFGKNTCNTYEVFAEVVHMPGGGTIPAQLLLELIERDENLTIVFSQWFLEAAITSAVELCEKTNSHVTLSLNLYPQFASQELFVERVLELLEKTGFNPRKLQFELSEAQSLSSKGVENLNRLHDEHGVGLYLANFGKGHANINLLKDVHFDGIELDRSFAAGVPEDDQASLMVFAIHNFAHALDLQVCAKGIETPEQFEFFEELKCFKGQGFIIGKPLPMAELVAYIEMYAIHAQEA